MSWRKEEPDDRDAGYRIVAVECPDGSIRTMIGAYGDHRRTLADWYVTGNLGGSRRSEYEGWCSQKGTKVLAIFNPPAYKKDAP